MDPDFERNGPITEITRLANLSGLWDTVGMNMKRMTRPGNHEDRKIEKLLERIVRKQSANRSEQDPNSAASRTGRKSPTNERSNARFSDERS